MSAGSSGTPRRVLINGVPAGVEPRAAEPAPVASPGPPSTTQSVPPWKRPFWGGVPTGAVSGERQAEAFDLESLERRIANNSAQLAADAVRLSAQMSTVAAAFSVARDQALRAQQEDFDRARGRADAAHRQAVSDADMEIAQAAGSAVARIHDVVRTLAPGLAGESWESDGILSAPVAAGPADYVRFGTAHVPRGEVPALTALQPARGWYVSGDPGEGLDLVFQAVLRLALQSPTQNLAIEVFDPRSTARMAPLAPLREINPAAFPSPAADGDAFLRRLDSLIESRVASNAEGVIAAGARSLTELWRNEQIPEGVLSVVVVLSYPYGVSERLHEVLLRLSEMRPSAGVVVLVQEDAQAPSQRGVEPLRLRERLQAVTVVGGTVTASDFTDRAQATLDRPPTAQAVSRSLDRLRELVSGNTGPTIPLEELISEDLEDPWRESSLEAVDATIGRQGRNELRISLRTENPAHPNLLIGGASGSGKSNLILGIVYSLAARYSPEELELILLDFKQGVEFSTFGPDRAGENWLPHVSVLGLESNQEFGVAVLRYVDAELERRSRLFKDAGVADILTYRRKTGRVLPRMVMVIDEFHEMFTGVDALTDAAVGLFDRFSRQGRSAGVHMILASQTTSGVVALRSKGDAIFGQFPLRLSLKNSAQGSEEILSSRNFAASELMYRGEFIWNKELGYERANQRGIAAYVDKPRFAGVQQRLWERGHGAPPMVFFGKRLADWDRFALDEIGLRANARDPLRLWVGRPIAVSRKVEELVVRNERDQSVAIVGQDDEREPIVPGLISGILHSAARQLGPDDEIVIVSGGSDSVPAWLPSLDKRPGDSGARMRHIPARHAARYLRDEIGGRVRESRGSILLVVLGASRIPDLELVPEATPGETNVDPVSEFVLPDFGAAFAASPASPSARDVLVRTAREGALSGVHLVTQWPSVSVAKDVFDYGLKGIGAFITVRLGLDDLRDLTGDVRARVDGEPRIGVIDRNADSQLKVVIPFEPWTAELERGMVERDE